MTMSSTSTASDTKTPSHPSRRRSVCASGGRRRFTSMTTNRLQPVRVGLQLASTLARMYGPQFRIEDAATLFGSKSMLEKIRAGADPAAIAASWTADEAKWRLTRAKYLLY